MRNTFLGVVLGLIVLIGVGAWLTLFTVNQTQQAIVLQFGNPVRTITTPGLHWKLPFIQNVVFFDKRLLDLDTSPQELIASDQKRLVVDAFARYRILNPLLFYQTVNNEAGARSQLSAILEAALRRVLGASSFAAVVSDQREALMRLISAQVNEEAKGYGVEVVDVRIKRADLPEQNSLAIYRRMQTQRQQEAAEIRARGEEASRRIRADADRQVVVLVAEATQKGEALRGDGDAERNRVFAEAFGADPDFFGFYRSMQAYESGLKPDGTRLVLSPDTEFFRYFNNPAGSGQPTAFGPPIGGQAPAGSQAAPAADAPAADGQAEAEAPAAQTDPAEAPAPEAPASDAEPEAATPDSEPEAAAPDAEPAAPAESATPPEAPPAQ
jgi:membrane protease subunit HflC